MFFDWERFHNLLVDEILFPPLGVTWMYNLYSRFGAVGVPPMAKGKAVKVCIGVFTESS
jgi:hypothetical protein